MNQDFYDGLPADLRAIVDEVRDDFNRGAAIEQFNSVNDEQCTALIDFPNTKRLTAWSVDATAEWKDLVQDQLIADYVQQAEADGLADAQGYFDAYVEALEQAGAGAQGDDPVSTCITRFEEK